MKKGAGNITYEGIDLYIEYEWSEYIPEVRTLSNGDPGFPAEGGDFDIYLIAVEGIIITSLLSDDVIEKIAEQYQKGK
jgi:hypothetical protein